MTPSAMNLIEKLWTASLPALQVVDPFEFRAHLLAVFFLKALNDVAGVPRSVIPTKASRFVFAETEIVIPPAAHFSTLVQPGAGTDPASCLHAAFQALATANPHLFSQWFESFDFRVTGPLGKLADPSEFLSQWLDVFQQEDLTGVADPIPFTPIGELYDALLIRLAHECDSRGTTFYAPLEITHLVAALLTPTAATTFFAPDCDTGSFFLPLAGPTPHEQIKFVGTESHVTTWALGQMRLFLHGQLQSRVYCPQVQPDVSLPAPFDFIIANPFFSSANWNVARPAAVRFTQPQRGKIPRRNMGFELVRELCRKLKDTGKMAAILPLGALFWGNRERRARQSVLESNWLEAIITLPSHLFLSTSYAFALLLLNRAKQTDDILLIDASHQYEAAKDNKRRRLHLLKNSALTDIPKLYQEFASEGQQAVRVTLEQVRKQGYDLSLTHYLPASASEEIDPHALQQTIAKMESELAQVRQELHLALARVGIPISLSNPLLGGALSDNLSILTE